MKKTYIIALALLAFSLYLNADFFYHTFRSPREITNDKPIVVSDATTIEYLMQTARQFDADSGKLWGYDPTYCAGYADAFVWNSCLPLHLAARAFPDLSTAKVFKYSYLLLAYILPLALFISALIWGASPAGAALALAPALLYLWHGEPANVMFAGNIASLAGYLLAVLLYTLFERFFRRPSYPLFVALLILSPITMMTHKLTVIVLAFPLVFSFIFFYRTKGIRPLLGLVIIGLVTLGVNSFWLAPMLQLLKYKVIISDIPSWASPSISETISLIGLGGRGGAKFILIIFGAAGLALGQKKHRTGGLTAMVFYLFVFAYFGGDLKLTKDLTPYRHIVGAFFCLYIASALFLDIAIEKLGRWTGEIPAMLISAAMIGVMILPPIFLIDLTNSYAVLFRFHPLNTSVPINNDELVKMIERHTDRSGRILLEDMNPRLKAVEGNMFPLGAHMFASLPGYRTDREFIGGPYPRMALKHHYADFQSGRFLGRELDSYSDEELDDAMRAYNIKWVAAWTDDSKTYFESRNDRFRRVDDFWPIFFYEVEREANYFIEGYGEARAEVNRIYLSEVTAPTGRAVIAYHWFEGFKTKPARKLIREMIGDDPVGFIAIENPPSELLIYNSYTFPKPEAN